MGVSQNWRYLSGEPHDKDHNILGSVLGSPMPIQPSKGPTYGGTRRISRPRHFASVLLVALPSSRFQQGLGVKAQVSSTWGPYLEGQGDLVTWLIIGITRVTMWFIGVIRLLTKFP